MGAPRLWSAAEIETVATMRTAGETWGAIGERLGISRTTVMSHAVKIGLWTPGSTTGDTTPKPARGDDPDRYRPAYPPGHAETWGIIVRGTCLENMEYPR
jgi:hypothetical protein